MEEYDLRIISGGVNGTAIARDAKNHDLCAALFKKYHDNNFNGRKLLRLTKTANLAKGHIFGLTYQGDN